LIWWYQFLLIFLHSPSFLGILFTVIGVIVLFNVEQTHSFIGALCVALVGLIILFFRIRKDVIEIRDDIKGK
jgi:hypothetical protein